MKPELLKQLQNDKRQYLKTFLFATKNTNQNAPGTEPSSFKTQPT